MTISAIDPRTALIVIDLQKGIIAFPTVHPIGEIIGRASALAETFRRRALPVVLVNAAGRAPGRAEQSFAGPFPPDWTELVPELNHRPQDHLVTKRTWGAFTNTGLADHLRKHDVTQVVIVGVATSVGVESTARQAHELGFHVTLAIDAMTDLSLEAHQNSLMRIFPRLGEAGTTADIIAHLDRSHA